ncbi:hypothetical protein F2Q68_00010412 [Brassica cretica]|uniref:Uncharacterized protein n=1 Tax=Brassica cretica TaxID=69181 RepID=A0A8S9KZG6_BRACR|nr:hypothetical protein F2Q68_00010412 [Brassica cretica]
MVTTGSFLPCCEFEPRWRELPHDVSGHHTDMGLCFRVALNEKNDKPTSTFEIIQQKLEGPSVSDDEKLHAEKSELQLKYNDHLAK